MRNDSQQETKPRNMNMYYVEIKYITDDVKELAFCNPLT